jgi:hypothetical protein
MISPIHMFDSTPITTGFEIGKQIGAVNSPYTPLGQALDKTMQKYDAHMAAQQLNQNAMALQDSKNQNDLTVAKIGAGYSPDGTMPAVDSTAPPELLQMDGPNGAVMVATRKPVKGRLQTSDWSAVVKPIDAKQEYENARYRRRIEARQGAQPNVIQQSATPQVPTAQPTERIKVRDAKGNVGTIPVGQLNDAMKQGYQRI